MPFNYKKFKVSAVALAAIVIFLSACNKAPEEILNTNPPVNDPTVSASRATLGDTLASGPYTLFYKMVQRAGKLDTLKSRIYNLTVFVPDNNAMKQFVVAASNGAVAIDAPDAVFEGFISGSLPVASAQAVVTYHILPNGLTSADIPSALFPNYKFPTIFNPAPTVSPLVRLDAYVGRSTNGMWKDNVPVIGPDKLAGNGVIHTLAAVTIPPSQVLWQRIATDPDMTYLKAAIVRADSGMTATTPGSLQHYLSDPTLALGANFTVFAPTNAAFQAIIYQLAYPIVWQMIYNQAYAQIYPIVYQQIYDNAIAGGATPDEATALATAQAPGIAQTQATAAADAQAPGTTTALASDPNIFQNPALFPYFSAQMVKGIVVYHMMAQRMFTVNGPTTTTFKPTLLNSAMPSHPGIGITTSFTGPVVTAMTVKGVGGGSLYPAANVIINPLPGASSDQRYVNGVLHKIDRVLLPQ